LQTPPTDEFFSAAFEGNYTKPILYKEVLSIEEIEKLYKKGLPTPELPSAVSTSITESGVLKAVFWENGDYQFRKQHQTKTIRIKECNVLPIESPWHINFPPHSGAPSSIQMTQLYSLHKHQDFGVKHFSGTAVYLTSFEISEKLLAKDQKILLHLGRVEVIAEVKLNEKNLGTLWKEPYQINKSD
jgi:hypothetical protein